MKFGEKPSKRLIRKKKPRWGEKKKIKKTHPKNNWKIKFFVPPVRKKKK